MKEKEKPRLLPGASQKISSENKPQAQSQSKPYETRRNAAACFMTSKTAEPHFSGLMVVEGWRDGDKCWVNIAVREVKSGKRAGQRYLSITLLPFRPLGGKK
jgi:hypothetical protein